MAEVTDPVCGMKIDSEKAGGSSTWQGDTYYFCGTGCKRKFDANPAQYAVRKRSASRAGQEPPFTKTGFLVAPKFGSAGGGGAEYDPGPNQGKN